MEHYGYPKQKKVERPNFRSTYGLNSHRDVVIDKYEIHPSMYTDKLTNLPRLRGTSSQSHHDTIRELKLSKGNISNQTFGPVDKKANIRQNQRNHDYTGKGHYTA
jgi:hypothetical protein